MTAPPVICERVFQQIVAGEASPLRVAWRRPVEDRNGWACDYVIEWPDRPWRSRRIFGVDALQALLLAMKMASSELLEADPPVFWLDQAEGDLGLPGFDDPEARTR